MSAHLKFIKAELVTLRRKNPITEEDVIRYNLLDMERKTEEVRLGRKFWLHGRDGKFTRVVGHGNLIAGGSDEKKNIGNEKRAG